MRAVQSSYLEQRIAGPAEYLLYIGIVVPAVYAFVVIQYSALVFPYWDHVNLARYILGYYDGTLHFSDLFASEAQSRPFIPRTVLLLNAIATDWDIRSEFSLLYLSLVGVWAAHLYFIWRIAKGLPNLPMLMVALTISILVFSQSDITPIGGR